MRVFFFFFFSSRRRHTISTRDWSSDVCSSDLVDDVDLVRGLGVLSGIDVVDVAGMTAGYDTDYEAQRDACLDSLRSEERRVGKECRSQWVPECVKEKCKSIWR